MEKERKITAPEGCEIEKVELIDGVAVVTFREKERKLPKSWEEFCEMFPIKKVEAYFSSYNLVKQYSRNYDRAVEGKTTLPDLSTAEAVLALCQLIQLRNCYNGDWVPDWNKRNEEKYFIFFKLGQIFEDSFLFYSPSPLYFKTEELCDEFLRNFRPLIEKLMPLYGIKE